VSDTHPGPPPAVSPTAGAPRAPGIDDGAPVDPKDGGKASVTSLKHLLVLMAPYKGRFAAATVALVFGSGLSLIYPQAARKAVDAGVLEGSLAQLDAVGVGLLGVFFVHSVFVWLRHYLMSWLGERVVADLRARVFEQVTKLPQSWFHERRSGEITGRLAADVTAIQSVIGSELSMSLREGITLVGGLAFLFFENWRLTLIMLAIVPPIVVLAVVFGRRIRRMRQEMQDVLADTSARAQEIVSGIAVVQAFVREDHEVRGYTARVEDSFKVALRLAMWRGLFMATMSFAGFCGVAAIIWIGGREIVKGELTPGDLAAFLLYTAMIATALGTLAQLWGSIQQAAGATRRVFDILETVPAIRDPERPASLDDSDRPIRFNNVTFAYPSRPGDPVLSDVDLSINPGETVAVVGRSGAGKSTLSQLLLRFHDPNQGGISFGDVDVRQLPLKELRRRFAVVSQDTMLFSGTIADNIAWARPDASRKDVEAAARAAHVDEFVGTFEQGYDTLVGERGVKLSGGQRQRVAIARALLADARVLILDEATSNLDGESEALVHDALARLAEGRTTLVIAHRLSTVRDADRIVVLDHGRVRAIGNHAALMTSSDIYRALVEHQLVS
jgi:ABC transporter fused permease/ATP-binding protein